MRIRSDCKTMFYFVFLGCICFPGYTYPFIVRSASEPGMIFNQNYFRVSSNVSV